MLCHGCNRKIVWIEWKYNAGVCPNCGFGEREQETLGTDRWLEETIGDDKDLGEDVPTE